MENSSLADITRSLPDAVVVADQAGDVLWSNDTAERLFGLTCAELTGTNILDVVHSEDRELAAVALAGIQRKSVGSPLELRVRTDTGWKLVEVIGANLLDHTNIGGLVLCMRDLTERRRWEVVNNEIGRFLSLVHNAASIIMLLEPTGRIESVSAAMTRQLGHDPEFVEGRPLSDFVVERDRSRLAAALTRALDAPEWNSGPTTVEVEMLRRDDTGSAPFELHIVNLVDDPTVGGLVVSAHDISQLRATQVELEGMSTRDPLTNLPNRTALCKRLERCLDDPTTSVVFLDLDGFKPVNDRFGHPVGDELLRKIGDRLRQSVRRNDFVARYGGDEFVVVARTEDARALEKLCQRLVRAIEQPTELSVGTIRLSVSVGVAHPFPKDTPDSILTRADTSMYTAKLHGDGLPHLLNS
jgi:diguanylate cyclase (GGDEF)-like protein/PAS domain S-box-containing protein